MRIDKDRLLTRLKEMGIGTGILADRAGIPANSVQRIIWTGRASKDEAEALIRIVGREVVIGSKPEPKKEEAPAPVTPPPPELTVREIIAGVESGEIDPLHAYEIEKQREKPRATLMHYLEEKLGGGK